MPILRPDLTVQSATNWFVLNVKRFIIVYSFIVISGMDFDVIRSMLVSEYSTLETAVDMKWNLLQEVLKQKACLFFFENLLVEKCDIQ